ncbi:MAG: tripartite tricarboxylate transporter substrate binding protein [Deltaproteobacteria bacterium]|nr:tripartite tricarboxylate transporter substrate binding protein [Deltaproteobacteria bacterium]
MKRFIVFMAAAALLVVSTGMAMAAFPTRPINLMVYTQPGGAIDVFARKFEAIAKKYTDATFVVVNKPGAGGIIAIKDIMASKADGYKILAVTKSNISKMVESGSDIKISDYSWIAMMVSDPEAIIVNRESKITTWQEILADAKAKGGNQLWVGPAKGGNDHIMAMKTWRIAGIQGKWIPYESGGKAMAALMGGHGAVYVGNPQDVVGRPNLKCAAISATERLSGEFADVPTFRELGISGLDEEIIWRGFMAKKGIPAEARAFYTELFRKVNDDPDWRKYILSGAANPVFYEEVRFTKIVENDAKEFKEALVGLGIIK